MSEKQTSMDGSWEKIKKKLEQPEEKHKTEGEEFPATVDWRETPEIMGTVEKIRVVTTTYNPEAFICDLRQPDGTLISFWLTTVLKSKFKRFEIGEGSRIGIKSLGKKENKRYYDFQVVVE